MKLVIKEAGEKILEIFVWVIEIIAILLLLGSVILLIFYPPY